MKKLTLLLFANTIVLNLAFAQGTAVNSTGASADSSAILDVSSSTQGMLIPRMSETNRVNILKPADGLLVYQTDVVKGFYYYNGAAWAYIGADNLGNHIAVQQLDMDTNKIINVAACTDNLDAANKAYVDGKVGAGGGGGTSVSDITPLMNGGSNLTWEACTDSCNNSSRNGYTDWHIPTFDQAAFYRSSITPPDSWTTGSVWTTKVCDYTSNWGYWYCLTEKTGYFVIYQYNSTSVQCRCVR